uniref:Uncharacterized protein n=1 Tax=Anopheles quadriannulatus TaxID=34691 RepID=A0A182XDC0_ANOQN
MKSLTAAATLLSSALVLLVLCHETDALSVRPRRDLVETGKAVILQGVSKLKDALDHGVNVKSEGKRSIDIFGFKFGGGSSVNTGFGDAANEDASANEDDLVRRRRALDVLGATYAYVSLLPQSPHGTNVNIVKVSSVSNVNNFGELPAAETATTVAAPVAERRRKRSPDMVQLAAFEKKSLSVDSELSPDKKLTTHERLESVRGGSRTLLRENVARNKRSPQSDGQEEGQDGGPPKGPPPRGGPKGPRGRGPPPGCPPPGGEEETTATTATVERRKREVVELVETERDKRSPKGGRGGASCRGGGGGGGSQGTPPPNAEVRRKRDTSNESSDYSTSDESDEAAEQNSGRSLAAHRNRRQALGGGEMSGKVGSWFEQLAGVFVDTVKKVVNVTKKTFGKGQDEP